jgi:hypothetical protein
MLCVRYLSIKNLAKRQHYKNRRPPWIKLHAEVLDDYHFGCLQDASKAHLMLLWVLASKSENRVPYDLDWIQQKLQATEPIDVEVLVLQGFVEVSQDDSKPLASRKQIVTTERETETEKRKKQPDSSESVKKGRSGTAPRYPNFPTADSDALYAAWQEQLRDPTVDRGRIRNAFHVLYEGDNPTYPLPELLEAVKVYAEVRATKPVDQWKWWHPNDFVKTADEWVRLGKMQPFEGGVPTDRGRIGLRGLVA